MVHVNTSDIIGGAGIAAYRLHSALKERCHDVRSSILVGVKATNDPDVVRICKSRSSYIANRVIKKFLLRPFGLDNLGPVFPPCDITKQERPPEIIHLHHIHGGFFSYHNLFSLSKFASIVWTLHDMWSFTGFCSHSLSCSGWTEGCHDCPQVKGIPSMLRTPAFNWKRKRSVYSKSRIAIVSPSKWLMKLVMQSPLHSGSPVFHIANGIDLDIFKPLDRAKLRFEHNISTDSLLLMAGLGKGKGSERLPQIISHLSAKLRKRIVLVLVGKDPAPDLTRVLDSNHLIALGQVLDATTMANWYSMADLFLLPTEADNLPNTLIEALACAIPAVTFDLGGCGEIVEHMKTGYLAREGDEVDFARGIALLLQEGPMPQEMRDECRRKAEGEFGVTTMAARYLELYQSLAEYRPVH